MLQGTIHDEVTHSDDRSCGSSPARRIYPRTDGDPLPEAVAAAERFPVI